MLTQVSRGDNPDGSGDKPIRNSAGDLYPDPVEVQVYDEIISVRFEKFSLDMAVIAAARGKINDSQISLNIPKGTLTFERSLPAKTVLLKTVDYGIVVSRVDPTAHKWGVSLVLIHRPDGFAQKLPQKGHRWNYDKEFGGQTVTQLTKHNDHAEYLDGDGYKLEAGAKLVAMEPPVQLHYTDDLSALLAGI